jgi:hypothetical protein
VFKEGGGKRFDGKACLPYYDNVDIKIEAVLTDFTNYNVVPVGHAVLKH